MRSARVVREAVLRGQRLVLLGKLPRFGERMQQSFSLPPARHADRPLTEADVTAGLVIVSTLPNIHRHSCLAQIVDLDEEAPVHLPQARVIQVSADDAEHWREVDRYHPNVQATSYTLCGADERSRANFTLAFGVGVEGHTRIAHGLFALVDGVFLAAEVPFDQMQTPPVHPFLHATLRALEELPCR